MVLLAISLSQLDQYYRHIQHIQLIKDDKLCREIAAKFNISEFGAARTCFYNFVPTNVSIGQRTDQYAQTDQMYLDKNTEISPEISQLFRCQIEFVDLVVETESQIASTNLMDSLIEKLPVFT